MVEVPSLEYEDVAVEKPRAKLNPEEAVTRPVFWSMVKVVLSSESLILKTSTVWEALALINKGKEERVYGRTVPGILILSETESPILALPSTFKSPVTVVVA